MSPHIIPQTDTPVSTSLHIITPQPADTDAKGQHIIGVYDYFTGVPERGQAYYWKSCGCWNSSKPFFSPFGLRTPVKRIEGVWYWEVAAGSEAGE